MDKGSRKHRTIRTEKEEGAAEGEDTIKTSDHLFSINMACL